MLIRKLNVTDAEAFKALRIAAVQESPLSFYPSATELDAMPIEEFLAQLNTEVGNTAFGAWMNGELFAIVGLQRDGREKLRHKVNIVGVYTSPVHRGHGIARQLVFTALEEARSLPGVVLATLSVYTNNYVAKSLYASFGFRSWGIERKSMLVNGEFLDEEHMSLMLDGS
jgi:RimJ/RimL family protein N-acetyltransferase